jgi:hypothetical protein
MTVLLPNIRHIYGAVDEDTNGFRLRRWNLIRQPFLFVRPPQILG